MGNLKKLIDLTLLRTYTNIVKGLIGTRASQSDLTTHTSDSTVHVTSAEKQTWNGKQDSLTAGAGLVKDGNTLSIDTVEIEVAQLRNMSSTGTIPAGVLTTVFGSPSALAALTDKRLSGRISNPGGGMAYVERGLPVVLKALDKMPGSILEPMYRYAMHIDISPSEGISPSIEIVLRFGINEDYTSKGEFRYAAEVEKKELSVASTTAIDNMFDE